MKKELFALLAVLFFAGVTGGAYVFLEGRTLTSLEQAGVQNLKQGNYLASLVSFSDLEKKTSSEERSALQSKVVESKNLLVAKEIFGKAQRAADDGEWLKVKALLEETDATTNVSFVNYKEAVDLYKESVEKVRIVEKKIAGELAALREQALAEKTQRNQAEERTTKTQKDLETTVLEKQKTQAELEEQKKETTKAKEDAEKERIKKFTTEVRVYLDMLTRGSEYLLGAITEIDNNKDTGALILINQGKVLFTEADSKASVLLLKRTPEEYSGHVQKLLQITALFISSARSLGSAVVYIDQRESDEFKKFFGDGKSARNNALSLEAELEAIVSSL